MTLRDKSHKIYITLELLCMSLRRTVGLSNCTDTTDLTLSKWDGPSVCESTEIAAEPGIYRLADQLLGLH